MTTSTTENEQTAQAAAIATEKPEPPKKANAGAQKPRVAPFKGKSGKCGLAPGIARDEGRRRTFGSRQGSIQPVLEQSGGAGPSESEATNPADAGIQAIRQRGGNDLRNRASREDQEGAVQNGQARVRCDDDGTVERGTRSLSPIRNQLQGGA